MNYLSNINRTDNCSKQFGLEYLIWHAYMYFCFLSLFYMQPTTKNPWITKLATRKKMDPRNTHDKKILDPRNTHEKNIWTDKKPTKKIFLDPQNNNEKNIWAHKIPTRKILDPQKHNGMITLDPRDPNRTQPTKFSTFYLYNFIFIFVFII